MSAAPLTRADQIYDEVNALGGSYSAGDYDRGYNRAIEDALSVLARHGALDMLQRVHIDEMMCAAVRSLPRASSSFSAGVAPLAKMGVG